MDRARERQITLYTRPGCHLCEEAAELIDRLTASMPLTVVEVNILEDADLFERYKHSIPVVALAGGPVLLAPFREADILRLLSE